MKEKEVKEMNGHGSTEHPTRKVLYQFIVENPGASFQLILNILKVPEGTLRYHLQQLQRSKRIIKERSQKLTSVINKVRLVGSIQMKW